MNKLATKIPALTKSIVDSSRPKLDKFLYYAKVELVPPTPGEFPEAVKGFNKVIASAKSGAWRKLTVREAWLNTLVAVEVACWFFVGECIGKRGIVGYNV